MGYNTALIIKNDFLHEIVKDADFGQKVRSAILQASREGHLFNSFDCLPSQHADTAQLVVIAANSIRALGYGHWKDNDETLLRRVADELGFRLVRKHSPAPSHNEEKGGEG